MKPRGFAATFVTIGCFVAVWFGLVSTVAISLAGRTSFADAFWPLGFGGGCGAGLAMALVATPTMHAITKTISFNINRTACVSRLTLLLAESNYHPQATVGDAISFARPVILLNSLHRLTVVVEEANATLFGPAELVTRLARTLDSTR